MRFTDSWAGAIAGPLSLAAAARCRAVGAWSRFVPAAGDRVAGSAIGQA